MLHVKQIAIIVFISFLTVPVLAEINNCKQPLPVEEQSEKILTVNLTGIGIITAWGLAKWDYFSNSPRSASEGWFQNDTKSGGADKLGHMYTSYVTSQGLSAIYEHWCFPKQDAAFYGAVSGLVITGYIEVGDSFSEFGFSKEDMVVNTLGSLLAYYTYIDPGLSSKLDFRWEYGFDPEGNDFTTDYENSKYLFALKLNGFESFNTSFLKHFELHLGYYTRGFSSTGDTKERNVFIGIGLNLTDLFERHDHHKTSVFLKYFQIPGTNMEFERDLNR